MIFNAAIQAITDYLAKAGITNQVMQAGILSRIKEESSFVPKSEISYRNTPNSRIRFIFKSRLDKYNEVQLTALKNDDEKFFDAVYLGRYGNTQPGDGYKYRGRGFNQITFKDNYRHYGKMIGVDLVNNPDLLNKPEVAAKAAAAYFADVLLAAQKNGSLKAKFGVATINDVKDTALAAKIALQANAGWAKNLSTDFFQEELRKMQESVQEFWQLIKRNPGTSTVIVIAIAILFFLVIRYLR